MCKNVLDTQKQLFYELNNSMNDQIKYINNYQTNNT